MKKKKYILLAAITTLALSGCKSQEVTSSQAETVIETTVETTEESTEVPTTEETTETPTTEKSTEAPTTVAPTEAVTEESTEALTEAPTTEATTKETLSPSDTKRKMIDSIIGMYQEGSLSSIDEAIEELDFFLGIENNTSPEEREAYIEEIKAAKPEKPVETNPVEKQEVQETAPVETKPVETKPVETTPPVVQESQGNTEVPAGLEDFFLSQEEIDKAGELHGEGGSANLTDEDWASVH